MYNYISTIKEQWHELLDSTCPVVQGLVERLIEENAQNIAEVFYSFLMKDPQSEDFLTNIQIENRLKTSLADWLVCIMSCRRDNIEQVIKLQQHVGEVHARIGIPLSLVEMACRVLRNEFFKIIGRSSNSDKEKYQMSIFIISSIDISTEIMSRSFSSKDTSSIRDDENYRIFSLIENADEEKERQVASLLEWEMDVIYKVMLNSEVRGIQTLSRSNFGIWFNHKGRHYFSGMEETGNILKLISLCDEIFLDAISVNKKFTKRNDRVNFLFQIRDNLSQITIILRGLFEEISSREVGVDVLTKLLNRRFLPTIFKREIIHANRLTTHLSVLIIDVDHFKEINDQRGHVAGDNALRNVSHIIYENVRNSDYVFRYGGDEFLIILPEASINETKMIAERIRISVQRKSVINAGDDPITITIGGAMFTGHPDYELLIHQADEALYQAKEGGRNRFVMYSSTD